MTDQSQRIGVLISNTGTPDEPTPQAVREYLKQFLSNQRIVPMNPVCWWFILRLFVLPKRSVTSAEKYQKVWTDEGSPILVIHKRLVDKLNRQSISEGLPYSFKLGMSFGKPSIPDALREFKREGVTRLIVLPLYPQGAFSTVKVVEDAVRAGLKGMSWRPAVKYVNGYWNSPSYARFIAAQIREAGFGTQPNDKLIYSFHSVPVADVERGDTYELSVGSSCLAISQSMNLSRKQWTIGFQCRFDKEREWLSPFTQQVLTREAQTDPHRIFYVCPNFSVDCLETIYDINYIMIPSYHEHLELLGKDPADYPLVYVPCLNDSERAVRLILEVIRFL